MEFKDIEWDASIETIIAQIEARRRNFLLKSVERLDALREQLEKSDLFNHSEFRAVRNQVGTQQEWAEAVGVSPATIGNYERNLTYPNKEIRKSILAAILVFREKQAEILNSAKSASISAEVEVDIVDAKEALEDTILDASLTDFAFDADKQIVIPVPFKADAARAEMEQIKQDRLDLTEALKEQSKKIAENLSAGANANVTRVISALNDYSGQCSKSRPNPRLLYRWGTTISRATATDAFSFGVNEFDKEALEGFVDDHRELMRLYYREALVKAQQVEAIDVDENAALAMKAEFNEIAEILEKAATDGGELVFSGSIPALLRDISSEIQEYSEAEILSDDEERKSILRRRRVEAVKNGSIVVGRILIFSSFLIVVDPMVALTTAGSIASILGVLQNESPGTVKRYYERMREVMPFLPKFPGRK